MISKIIVNIIAVISGVCTMVCAVITSFINKNCLWVTCIFAFIFFIINLFFSNLLYDD